MESTYGLTGGIESVAFFKDWKSWNLFMCDIKKIMSYLLIAAALLITSKGEGRFFDSGVDFFDEEKIKKSISEEPEINNKIRQYQKQIKNSQHHTQKTTQRPQLDNKPREVTLFMTPDCRFNKTTIEGLLRFIKNKPYWTSKVCIIGSTDAFARFVMQNQELLEEGIPIKHDIMNKISEKYSITKTPAYPVVKMIIRVIQASLGI